MSPADPSDGILKTLDDSGLRKGHIKTMIVAGMGFFTDAYLLFVLTVAMPILASPAGFNLKVTASGSTVLFGYQVANLSVVEGGITSAALFGAFAGAFIFGNISDRMGRKAVYGMELGIIIAFTVISAFSVNSTMLVISRFLLGIGVGGDYPISSTIMSEYSSSKHRGKLVGMVFAMQGLGLLAGALVGLVAIYTIPLSYSWRFMLGFGAVPAFYVVYLRRKMLETPRFSLQVRGNAEYASRATRTIVGGNAAEITETVNPVSKKTDYSGLLRKYMTFILGTSITWFIFDMAFYGTTLNNSFILNNIGYGTAGSLKTAVTNTAIGDTVLAAAFAVPGYFIAVATVDIVGRKALQWFGFLVMAVSYLVLGIFYNTLENNVGLFITVFGISYLFGNIGPNTTTFILPTELFPTEIRATAHGIASSVAKLGAGIFTFLFLILGFALGQAGEFELLALFSTLGAVITLFTIRETKGLPLELTSLEPSKGIIGFDPYEDYTDR